MASKNRRKHARYVDHVEKSGPVIHIKPDYVTGGYVDSPEYRAMMEASEQEHPLSEWFTKGELDILSGKTDMPEPREREADSSPGGEE